MRMSDMPSGLTWFAEYTNAIDGQQFSLTYQQYDLITFYSKILKKNLLT